MDTSTPSHMGLYRTKEIIPEETSPISAQDQDTSNGSDSVGIIANNKPTQISDCMDQSKLTPVKVVSESAEERNLMGGAQNLSNAYKKSTSLPNLSWDNVDNSLFIGYPTRNKLYVTRTRSKTVGTIDGVDCSGWSHGDFSNDSNKCVPEKDGVFGRDNSLLDNNIGNDVSNKQLENVNTPLDQVNMGSPMLRSTKRRLNISPNTPVGLVRKIHQECDKQPVAAMITFGEDVEMEDLDYDSSERDVNVNCPTPNDRIIKMGLRRKLLKAVGDKLEQDSSERILSSNVNPNREQGAISEPTGQNKVVNVKGKPVKLLSRRTKLARKNYKSTKKKGSKAKDSVGIDESQRLMDEFINKMPCDKQVLAGQCVDEAVFEQGREPEDIIN